MHFGLEFLTNLPSAAARQTGETCSSADHRFSVTRRLIITNGRWSSPKNSHGDPGGRMCYLQVVGMPHHLNHTLETNNGRTETHLVCYQRGPALWIDFLHTLEQLWDLVVFPIVPWYYSPPLAGWRQHSLATRSFQGIAQVARCRVQSQWQSRLVVVPQVLNV